MFNHLLTVSPAGGGKSVNTIIPNLLSYRGNCVVIDPKGELYKNTSAHRRKRFGHKIVRLDPASVCGPGAHCFNPYDFINADSKDFIDECRDLANMLVIRTGKEHDPHWNDSAENVISALTAFVCACEGDRDSRNLRGMRTFLASRENFAIALGMMEEREGFYGVLQQLGRSLDWHVDKELASVMSSAQRHTNIYDSPLIAESTNHTSFNPSELRTGKMTVYIIIPSNRLVVWAGLQRIWLGSLIRIITRGTPTEKNPVLFIIDETANIGKMAALEDAVTLLRGMGIRVWLFFQSIEQLTKCFGENASTVLDNLGTQQYFGINSYDTAENLSKRIGDETIRVTTEGDNTGTSSPIGGNGQNARSRSSGTSRSTTETGRRLLKPEEILRLSRSEGLLFHEDNPVIIFERIRWYADRAFRRGGTGKSRGLGFRGALLAMVILLVAGVATLIVVHLPEARFQQGGGGPLDSFFNPEGERIFREPEYAPSPQPVQQPPFFQPSRPVIRHTVPPTRRGW